MSFLNDVWKAMKQTAYEFQAGPRAKKKHKPLRLRRVPLLKKPTPRPMSKEESRIKPMRKVLKGEVWKGKTFKSLPKQERMYIKRERANLIKQEPLQDWEKQIDQDDTGINQKIEPAQDRVERIVSEPVKKKVRENRRFYETNMSAKRRHLLFMNPGTEKINEAVVALRTGNALPKWAQSFSQELSIRDEKEDEKMAEVPEPGSLLFEGLPMLTKEEKRREVKLEYFNPKGFSTIGPITDALQKRFANVSRANVTHILRSLETYQRNFARRRPPRVMGRMMLKNPGVIAMDMFFPTRAIAGWEGKYACLTCMDCWSRFTWVYALENKSLPLQIKAMNSFLQKFAAFGWMPRRILTDRGSDMKGAKRAIEPYRTAKDGDGPMVVHSETAQPVNIVEAMNSQVQRRMQVFRTSSLTDDPSILLDDISFSINNQKRPNRGNLSPNQLLALTKEEINTVNNMWQDRTDIPEVLGLRKLRVGDAVRILLMTRKQQAQNSVKGFTAKWSREVYTVLKKTGIPRNQTHYRYSVGTNRSYYRHELLWIPRNVDTETFDLLERRQRVVVEEEWSDLEYDSDDSRA